MDINCFQGRAWFGWSVKRHCLETPSMLLDVHCSCTHVTSCTLIIGKTEVSAFRGSSKCKDCLWFLMDKVWHGVSHRFKVTECDKVTQCNSAAENIKLHWMSLQRMIYLMINQIIFIPGNIVIGLNISITPAYIRILWILISYIYLGDVPAPVHFIFHVLLWISKNKQKVLLLLAFI